MNVRNSASAARDLSPTCGATFLRCANWKKGQRAAFVMSLAAGIALAGGCTQERQNELGRAVQNWTGTDGVLEIYAGDKLVKKFIRIDKLTTATGTSSGESRPYRFGYGVLDTNSNGAVDPGEKKVYFEFSDYSTSYVFYENPR